MIAGVLDSAWWALAVLFLAVVVGYFVAELRAYHARQLGRMSDEWRERWHREHR